jgi:RNA polymerase sigma-70 factor (ECF subfamily)
MSEDPKFPQLIRRVRAGDARAAEELIEHYVPAIRRTLRAQLRDSQMRRLLDSQDICQSVLASFFVRAALGRYELETPEHLLTLLTSMAHHKLTNQVRRYRAKRRDQTRNEATPVEEWAVAAPDPSPSRQVASKELLEEALRRLSPEERRLLQLRQEGRSWAEIAQEVGGSSEALRKQLERAVERVAKQLGLDETPPV